MVTGDTVNFISYLESDARGHSIRNKWKRYCATKAFLFAFLFFMKVLQHFISLSLIKRFLYPMNTWIWIFSSQTVFGIALNQNRPSIDKSLKASIAATTLTLFVKHSSMTLSFYIGLSFEKDLGLLITLLCSSPCGSLITMVSVPLSIPFFVIFVGILTSLKTPIKSF